jgi:hypothetical protein
MLNPPVSIIKTSDTNKNNLFFNISHSSTIANTYYQKLDDILMFNSGSYTKTQLDASIAYFGYFPYNETINVPDVTNGQWTSESFAYILENASDYNGTLTDLDIANTWNWFQIETAYSITLDNADKAYLWQLYEDAVNEVDRYEWYTQFGITSSNYAGMLATYQNLDDWYGDGIGFAFFDNTTVEYDRTAPTPPEEKTVVEKIEDYLTEDLNLAGISDFVFGFIAIFITAGIVLLLALLKAHPTIMILFGALFMIMFIVIGWFPFWLALIMVLIVFGLIFFLKPKGAV